jgi:nucleoside-diphosphate-sugar epimerase
MIIMTKKILITGASGTVGKAAGRYLCSEGFEVIGVSRSVDKESDCYTDTLNLDLLDQNDVQKLENVLNSRNIDAVFHLAWNIPVENFDTYTAWEPNMDMFENVLNATIKSEVPVFINGSSIHAGTGDIPAYTVEGDLEKTPEPYKSSIDPNSSFDLRKDKPEKLLSPLREKPDSPYGWSKVMTERKTKNKVEKGEIKLGVSIRIGGVNPEDKKELEGEPFYPSLYWSHKDLGKTIENIVKQAQKETGYHQFYGVSDNEGRIFSIENRFHSKKD